MSMVVGGTARRLNGLMAYAALAVLTLFCLFPFVWMLDTALKPLREVQSLHPSLTILRPSLDSFRRVLFQTAFPIYFRNSLIVSVSATLVTLIIGVFAGYVLSRWPHDTLSRTVGSALLLSQMIPGVLLLVPLYMLMRQLGLLSSYTGLIVVYCTFTVPLCTFMLKGFFDAVPPELEQAAEMDGCSRTGFIYRILLPLSAPGVLAAGAFAFVNAWNEFMFGYVFINDDAHRTLTPGIMMFKSAHVTDWGALMAASVLTVLPVAACFLYLQRFLIEGLAAGAVKG
jgi:multiple sugar transport system permease protein